jgi:hypothetical protein
MNAATVYFDPEGTISGINNRLGENWKLSLGDALYAKAIARPIQNGDKMRGVLLFTFEGVSPEDLKKVGTKFKLHCVDVENQPVESEHTWSEKTEPFHYYPGLSPIPH